MIMLYWSEKISRNWKLHIFAAKHNRPDTALNRPRIDLQMNVNGYVPFTQQLVKQDTTVNIDIRTLLRTLRPSDGCRGRKTHALWTQDAGRRRVKLFLGSTVI